MTEPSAPATENEIATAIIRRLAGNNGDSLTTACQLAKILAPYGIAYDDLQEGLPPYRRNP